MFDKFRFHSTDALEHPFYKFSSFLQGIKYRIHMVHAEIGLTYLPGHEMPCLGHCSTVLSPL